MNVWVVVDDVVEVVVVVVMVVVVVGVLVDEMSHQRPLDESQWSLRGSHTSLTERMVAVVVDVAVVVMVDVVMHVPHRMRH